MDYVYYVKWSFERCLSMVGNLLALVTHHFT